MNKSIWHFDNKTSQTIFTNYLDYYIVNTVVWIKSTYFIIVERTEDGTEMWLEKVIK